MSSGILESEIEDFILNVSEPLRQKLPTRPKKTKVIVLSGPTGVGKTDLSLIIANALGGEIISADSMQVYRGMDIGTSKVSQEDRKRVPHHLIDIRDLNQTFNVVDFYHEATRAIHDILAKEHVPIIVGGTGFYLHALLYGPPSGPPSTLETRQELENEMEKVGSRALYERLRQLDADYAATITGGDRHKIIRALEIIYLTNKKVSDFHQILHSKEIPYDFRCWFLYMPKEILYPRINRRCEYMLESGFLQEVSQLEPLLRNNLSASQAIGYRQALDFLKKDQNEVTKEQFIQSFQQASRRYAKRQFTWFRKEPLFRWLNLIEKTAETAVEIIIQDYELSF